MKEVKMNARQQAIVSMVEQGKTTEDKILQIFQEKQHQLDGFYRPYNPYNVVDKNFPLSERKEIIETLETDIHDLYIAMGALMDLPSCFPW